MAAAFLAAAAYPAFAETASASARLGGGKTAAVNAVKPAEGATYLEIALPTGTQKLDGLGEQFLPLRVRGRDTSVVAAEFDKDGSDEIVIRGLVTPSDGAVIVLRWDASRNEFLPAAITNSDENTKPFLFAANSSTVAIENDRIEVHLTRIDQSGRRAQIVERYHWDGDGLKYFEDH
jgi:hypothetical protein